MIWSWSVLDGWGEYADLTEEYGDQERGAGGVGGGRQEVGEPGGHREHRGGEEVVVDVLHILTLQLYLDTGNGEGPIHEEADSRCVIPGQIPDTHIVSSGLRLGARISQKDVRY